MAVAFVMDFPGATAEQYDQVIEWMGLNGRLAPGGLFHAAGATPGGWRVYDVWESAEQFEAFAGEQIGPLTARAGIGEPRIRSYPVHNVMRGDGHPAFLQVVTVKAGADDYDAINAEVAPGNAAPEGGVFHAAGPTEDGWIVVDAWTSREARDQLLERLMPVLERHGIDGPPAFEEMDVHNTLA
jgi:hypothetical protein